MSYDNVEMNTKGKVSTMPKYVKKMNKKQVEEAVCWILSKEQSGDFEKRLRMAMYELRGKADSSLIRKVVENYNVKESAMKVVS